MELVAFRERQCPVGIGQVAVRLLGIVDGRLFIELSLSSICLRRLPKEDGQDGDDREDDGCRSEHAGPLVGLRNQVKGLGQLFYDLVGRAGELL